MRLKLHEPVFNTCITIYYNVPFNKVIDDADDIPMRMWYTRIDEENWDCIIRLNKESHIWHLVHELYHVFQFCKGWLKIKNAKRYWNTSIIDDLDYINQPHEIQAEEQELILYQDFVTFLDEAWQEPQKCVQSALSWMKINYLITLKKITLDNSRREVSEGNY